MIFFKIYSSFLEPEIMKAYKALSSQEFLYWAKGSEFLQKAIEILKKHPNLSVTKEVQLLKEINLSKEKNFYYFLTNGSIESLFKEVDKKEVIQGKPENLPFVTRLNGKKDQKLLKVMSEMQMIFLKSQEKNTYSFFQDVLIENMKKYGEKFREFLQGYLGYLTTYLEIKDVDILKTNYQRAGLISNLPKNVLYGIKIDVNSFSERDLYSVLHNLSSFLEINVVDEVTIIYYYLHEWGSNEENLLC